MAAAVPGVWTPYSTARPFFGVLPSWLPEADAERLEAYTLYEKMYWNVPDTFKLVQRGTDSNPIYIPSAKTIVEATNRFLAKDWTYAIDPQVGTPADQEAVRQMLQRLFKRELVWSKFATQRRFGLIRGDSVWHIVADETKPVGNRISLYELDPASYFPIYENDNIDRRIGCHLVDQVLEGDKTVLRRQTYRKTENGQIESSLILFELSGWDDRVVGAKLKQVRVVTPPFLLPPAITQLPVYHIKNNRTPGDPFGSSELRGLETLIAAVNQATTDQDLALALQGLGLYYTTSGPPVDENGDETNWRLGPGRVVEIDPDSEFGRVPGVSSVQPSLDHIRFVQGETFRAAGVPDVAAGNVDVSIAESGIALYLQLSPLLAKNAEKEQEMLGTYDHMLYDLTRMWLPAYEALGTTTAEVLSVVQDPMPVNRSQKLNEIIMLFTSQLVTIEWAQAELTKLGFEFSPGMFAQIVKEQSVLTRATSFDPFASRVEAELGQEQ